MRKLDVGAIAPEELEESDLKGIHEVMQDMWASEAGIWELAKCGGCGKMISKESAFRKLPSELAEKTVAEVFRILGDDRVDCPDCGSAADLVYGNGNAEKIRDRLQNSQEAYVVVARNPKGEIVGFEEAYVDGFDRIFDLDLTDHYGEVGRETVRERVAEVLGRDPERLILLSSLGLLKPYRSFRNLFSILAKFSETMPDSLLGTPGLTEMHLWGVTYRISEGVADALPLGIEERPEIRAKMRSVGEKYESRLVAYRNPVLTYKEHFTKGVKHFVRTKEAAGRTVANAGDPDMLSRAEKPAP